jgi:hypothetical protein
MHDQKFPNGQNELCLLVHLLQQRDVHNLRGGSLKPHKHQKTLNCGFTHKVKLSIAEYPQFAEKQTA